MIDFSPTILKLAGAQIPVDLTGLDLLDRKAMTARKSVFVEAYTHNIADLDKPAESLIARVVIDGWSKLIIPGPNKPDRPFSTVPEGVALYDLMTDPLEKTNIAAKRPDEVKRLTALQNAHWLVE